MSSILRSPCSVVSMPFFVRPSRWAIQMELFPDVIHVLIYLERTCDDKYNSRALIPRMTLIIRLDLIRYSMYLFESKLLPTAISVVGMPFL